MQKTERTDASMNGIPLEIRGSKIPARAEPLSAHRNAKVTPSKSAPDKESMNLRSTFSPWRKLS
jgi:hypothetical protein